MLKLLKISFCRLQRFVFDGDNKAFKYYLANNDDSIFRETNYLKTGKK